MKPVIGTTGKQCDPEQVNHPAHYNMHPSGVECIEIKRYLPSNVGDAFKYLFRSDLKEALPMRDRKKALWYIEDQIATEREMGFLWRPAHFPSGARLKLTKVLECEQSGYIKHFLTGLLLYTQGDRDTGLDRMKEAIVQSIAHE